MPHNDIFFIILYPEQAGAGFSLILSQELHMVFPMTEETQLYKLTCCQVTTMFSILAGNMHKFRNVNPEPKRKSESIPPIWNAC